MLTITAVVGSVLALIYIRLAFNVINLRQKHRVSLGAGDRPDLDVGLGQGRDGDAAGLALGRQLRDLQAFRRLHMRAESHVVPAQRARHAREVPLQLPLVQHQRGRWRRGERQAGNGGGVHETSVAAFVSALDDVTVNEMLF